jgi:hypothetical protein
VRRAARIEPITPTRQVNVSEAFAALAAAQGVTDFACDYFGQTPMAKGYGTLPTYHVHPTSYDCELAQMDTNVWERSADLRAMLRQQIDRYKGVVSVV